jgi:GTP cyclohydrolase I
MSEQNVSKQEAEQAVGVLLKYIGEDLSREGLKDTPARVVRSYKELFSGYGADIQAILDKRFYEISSYSDIILLKKITFSSICEHHMLPFYGHVDVAYVPDGFVVGISKIARLVDAYAKRLQIQERLTSNIAGGLQTNLNPKGVAVRISASHSCMIARGTLKYESVMDTTHFTGVFRDQPELRQEFLRMIKG